MSFMFVLAFNYLKEENMVRKGENYQQCFHPYQEQVLLFQVMVNLSSATALNLDHPKVLLLYRSRQLTLYHTILMFKDLKEGGF